MISPAANQLCRYHSLEIIMISLKKMAELGLGVAIATSLASPALAQTAPQPESPSASALGGPLTPSNSALFQAQAEPTEQTIKVEETDKEQASVPVGNPLEWQSEHLDNQRRGESGFSFINVNL
jgi:hypothetical protein